MPVQKNGREIFNDSDINNPDIDGGTIDGATIATSNITVGAGKTLDVSAGTLTLANDQISGDKVEGGTIAAITITALTTTTQADNNSSTLPATTAFAKSQDAVLAREPDQGVAMTAAASGSSGITVADSDNIDFGTGNFTPYFDGLVPDFTPSAALILMQKWATNVGYELGITATTGYVYLKLNTTTYTSSVAPTAVDGTRHKIVASVTIGAVNTTVDFYFDGVVLGAQQTAANPGTVSNAASLYILGTSAVRTAGTVNGSGTYNRALTAAEVLDLYRNGIAESDKWGSQTELIASVSGSGDNNTLTSDTGWWSCYTDMGGGITGGVFYAKATLAERNLIYRNNFVTKGKYYTVQFEIKDHGGGVVGSVAPYVGGTLGTTRSAVGIYTETIKAGQVDNYFILQNIAATTTLDIDNIYVWESGATLALIPEGINANQWYDSSTNNLNATYPTTGYSFTRSMEAITTSNLIAESNSLVIKPVTDATTAIQIADKDGNVIGNFDTTNNRFGVGTASPLAELHVSSDVPNIAIGETGVTADNGIWDFTANAEIFYGRVVSDAYDSAANWIQVDRTGVTVDSVSFPNGNVVIGNTTANGKLDVWNGNFTLSDTDVAHGMTNILPTTAYALFSILSSTAGGLNIVGASDTGTNESLIIDGILGSDNPSDTIPAILLRGGKKNGATWQALGAAETVFKIGNTSTDLITVLGSADAKFANNLYIGSTTGTFGTSAAKVLALASGTAPTTSPADAAQVWVADEGSRAGYASLHMRNEAGATGAVAFQAPLQNLLTNTQWIAASGSTLENVGSAIKSDAMASDNTANWTKVNAALTFDTDHYVYNPSGAGNYVQLTTVSVTLGKLYKISVDVKNGAGSTTDLQLTLSDGVAAPFSANIATTAGWVTHTFVIEAMATTAAGSVSIYDATNFADDIQLKNFTLYEVTPGYVAADTLAPDGWYKDTTLDVHREHSGTNTKDGSFYALKLTKGADSVEYFGQVFTDYWRIVGKTITVGWWVKTSNANSFRPYVYDSGATNGPYHTGSGNYEWLELTYSVPTGKTAFQAGIVADGNTSDVAYVSQPMLVYGSSIGAGNYAPPFNEQILTQANITLTGYTATTSAADGIINLEAASSGMIGKGVKAVLVKAYGKDSAAGDGVGFDVQSASGVEDGISVDTQVNNIRVSQQGLVKCDANGDIYFDHRGSGAAALTVDIKVIGIQS